MSYLNKGVKYCFMTNFRFALPITLFVFRSMFVPTDGYFQNNTTGSVMQLKEARVVLFILKFN